MVNNPGQSAGGELLGADRVGRRLAALAHDQADGAFEVDALAGVLEGLDVEQGGDLAAVGELTSRPETADEAFKALEVDDQLPIGPLERPIDVVGNNHIVPGGVLAAEHMQVGGVEVVG